MIRKTLLIFFLFIHALAYSQNAVSDSADYYLQKGLQEKNERRYMQSLRYFEKAFQLDSTNKAVVAELANANYELRRYYQAIDLYKKLEALGDKSAGTYKQLMLLSYNFKRNDDVILYAKKLKDADPSEKINYYLGKVYYNQDDYGNAIKYLEAAAKEDPKNAEAPYLIARSYADMQNYKQSIPFFLKAIDLDSTKNGWVYELGLIYYSINDNKNALKYILLAGERGYKKDNDYLQNVAIAYLNTGQSDQAIKILQDVLKKKPSDINVLNMLAEAHYDIKKYNEAIDYWDQILGYDKQNASALYMIGMSYQKKGEEAKGKQLCDKAIEMDPSLGSLKKEKKLPGM